LINKVAEKNNIACMMGGMLESRVALTAKVHFAMANDNIKFYDLDTCLLGHLSDPVIGGVTYSGMQLQLSDAPGIGADVDNSLFKKTGKGSYIEHGLALLHLSNHKPCLCTSVEVQFNSHTEAQRHSFELLPIDECILYPIKHNHGLKESN
jgi:hypothetical protein